MRWIYLFSDITSFSRDHLVMIRWDRCTPPLLRYNLFPVRISGYRHDEMIYFSSPPPIQLVSDQDTTSWTRQNGYTSSSSQLIPSIQLSSATYNGNHNPFDMTLSLSTTTETMILLHHNLYFRYNPFHNDGDHDSPPSQPILPIFSETFKWSKTIMIEFCD